MISRGSRVKRPAGGVGEPPRPLKDASCSESSPLLFSAAVRKLPRQKRGLGAAQGRFGYFVARDKVTRAGARNSP